MTVNTTHSHIAWCAILQMTDNNLRVHKMHHSIHIQRNFTNTQVVNKNSTFNISKHIKLNTRHSSQKKNYTLINTLKNMNISRTMNGFALFWAHQELSSSFVNCTHRQITHQCNARASLHICSYAIINCYTIQKKRWKSILWIKQSQNN